MIPCKLSDKNHTFSLCVERKEERHLTQTGAPKRHSPAAKDTLLGKGGENTFPTIKGISTFLLLTKKNSLLTTSRGLSLSISQTHLAPDFLQYYAFSTHRCWLKILKGFTDTQERRLESLVHCPAGQVL